MGSIQQLSNELHHWESQAAVVYLTILIRIYWAVDVLERSYEQRRFRFLTLFIFLTINVTCTQCCGSHYSHVRCEHLLGVWIRNSLGRAISVIYVIESNSSLSLTATFSATFFYDPNERAFYFNVVFFVHPKTFTTLRKRVFFRYNSAVICRWNSDIRNRLSVFSERVQTYKYTRSNILPRYVKSK